MVGSMDVYEFLRMPYGLCNVPATFQRLMQNCLGELNLTYALIYLEDVIVYSKTEEEHLVCLHTILEWFMEHGLKLKGIQVLQCNLCVNASVHIVCIPCNNCIPMSITPVTPPCITRVCVH